MKWFVDMNLDRDFDEFWYEIIGALESPIDGSDALKNLLWHIANEDELGDDEDDDINYLDYAALLLLIHLRLDEHMAVIEDKALLDEFIAYIRSFPGWSQFHGEDGWDNPILITTEDGIDILQFFQP